MLDLAISIDTDPRIIETNNGLELKAPDWPQDSDFQLVAFDPSKDSAEVVSPEDLAGDISEALMMLDRIAPFKRRKPDWYRRLKRCAAGGASS
jgi:hypothetical protein